MAYGIVLNASHPSVHGLVDRWLQESRLELDRPLTLNIEVGQLPVMPADARAVFRQGNVEIQSGAGSEPVRLEWSPGLGRARLNGREGTADVVITEEGLERAGELLRSFLLNVCILLLRRAGLHHVHAATLRDKQRRGWLLVGVSRSGKSTTSVLLARNGWAVGTDDIAFFSPNPNGTSTDMVAWRERLALREDSVMAVGPQGGTDFTSRRKTGWFAEELGAEWLPRVTPDFLVFPTVHAGEPSAVRPMRATEALSRLMKCSPWVALEPDFASEHLELMARLTKQTRAFDLSLGRDLFDRPELILDLIE